VTAQNPDLITYAGEHRFVAAVRGEGLFDPRELGRHPAVVLTSCWRGYMVAYAVENDQLLVKHLALAPDPGESLVDLASRGGPPILWGKLPLTDPQASPSWRDLGAAFSLGGLSSMWIYESLDHPVSFTGYFLLADEVPDGYSLGRPLGEGGRGITELGFDRGRLIESRPLDECYRMFGLRRSLLFWWEDPAASARKAGVERWLARRPVPPS
jgi:hypothetical protein